MSMYGINDDPDSIGDVSPKAFQAMTEHNKALLDKMTKLDKSGFSKKEKNDFARLKGAVELDVVKMSLDENVPIFHMIADSLVMQFGAYQSLKTANDVLDFIARLKCLPAYHDGYIECFRNGIKVGQTLPRDSIERMIVTFKQLVTEDPLKSRLNLREKIADKTFLDTIFVTAIQEYANPAFLKFAKFLEDDYLQHARAYPGLYKTNEYEKIYNDQIYINTSLRYTADELNAIGQEEVRRISQRMEQVKSMVFEGTLPEFRKAIKDKTTYLHLYKDRDSTIPFYESLMAEIDAKLPQYFSRFPKAKCMVKAVKKGAEGSSPIAFYMPGNGDIPGSFYANLKDCDSSPMHSAMALVLHEANPGHHHQITLVNEGGGLHTIDKIIFNTSYVEGWGLYSEYLGEEMDMYHDPLSLFGRLELEMFRALRLVLDTSLHTKGWSIDECVDLMREHITMSEDEMKGEAIRYASMPGQALAYKVGELKIKELRKKAEERLGELFDLKGFHDVVLDNGSVTLDALEINVNEWVEILLQ